MARRAEEAENHWPGFVDALSTIVMVVTFLLIIMAVVIFAISQRIAETYFESDTKSEESGPKVQTGKRVKNTQKTAASGSADSKTKTEQNKNLKAASGGGSAREGSFEVTKSQAVTQDEQVESDTKLTIRSREVRDEKEIVVASDEVEKRKPKPVAVTKAKSVLTLAFDDITVKLDLAASRQIKEHLAGVPDLKNGAKLEIWSFAAGQGGSVSERKRLAYYRAMSVRNDILASGVDAKNIAVRVGVSKSDKTKNRVKVFVKP